MTAPRQHDAIFDDDLVDGFHELFYAHTREFETHTRFLGHPIAKSPLDLWLLQQVIYRTQPDLIIETGTWLGGSAFFYASLFDLMQAPSGRVVSIDVEDRSNLLPGHQRITFLHGDSANPLTRDKVRSLFVGPSTRVMVVLDSQHEADHVLKELSLWPDLVTPDCYLVVEDGNIGGHPVSFPEIDHDGGPTEALQAWLVNPLVAPHWLVDRTIDTHYLFTFNPGGWLRRLP